MQRFYYARKYDTCRTKCRPGYRQAENQRDLIAVAHGGQSVLTDELSGYQAVRNIIELLENDASKQREAEPAQYCVRLPNRQIFVHRVRFLSLG